MNERDEKELAPFREAFKAAPGWKTFMLIIDSASEDGVCERINKMPGQVCLPGYRHPMDDRKRTLIVYWKKEKLTTREGVVIESGMKLRGLISGQEYEVRVMGGEMWLLPVDRQQQSFPISNGTAFTVVGA